VGTAAEGRNYYWAWDANISFIRDILNPSVFFTFRDQKGHLLQKVRYDSYLLSWGLKFEISVRPQLGIMLGGPKDIDLNEIPEKLMIKSGWDIGFYLFNVGWITLKDFPSTKILFVGLGNPIGATQIDPEHSYLTLNKFEDCQLVE